MGFSVGVGTGFGPVRVGYWFRPMRYHRVGLIGAFALFMIWTIKASIGFTILAFYGIAMAVVGLVRLIQWATAEISTARSHDSGSRL